MLDETRASSHAASMPHTGELLLSSVHARRRAVATCSTGGNGQYVERSKRPRTSIGTSGLSDLKVTKPLQAEMARLTASKVPRFPIWMSPFCGWSVVQLRICTEYRATVPRVTWNAAPTPVADESLTRLRSSTSFPLMTAATPPLPASSRTSVISQSSNVSVPPHKTRHPPCVVAKMSTKRESNTRTAEASVLIPRQPLRVVSARDPRKRQLITITSPAATYIVPLMIPETQSTKEQPVNVATRSLSSKLKPPPYCLAWHCLNMWSLTFSIPPSAEMAPPSSGAVHSKVEPPMICSEPDVSCIPPPFLPPSTWQRAIETS
mmetsp:Transcript_10366/g.17398  ORF Transcript_10366/g.17398 Transcript_10366/m.17398 type:complete len:320 (+) Transcript_10366:347-1306(+)